MCDILSPSHSTLSIADKILLHTKNLNLIYDSHSPEQCIAPTPGSIPLLSHLTSCALTKYNLRILILLSQLSWVNLPYIDLLYTMYHTLDPFSWAEVRPKYLSRSEGLCCISKQTHFLWWAVLATCPVPKLEDHSMTAAITAHSVNLQLPFISGGRLLYLQPEDVSRRVDKANL